MHNAGIRMIGTSTMKLTVAIFAASLFCCTIGRADYFAVVPSEYTNLEPGYEIGEPINGYSSTLGQTVQYVIPNGYLTGLQNQELTGLSFRLNTSYDPVLGQITYSDYTVQLSTFSGASLSSTFANNEVNPVTVMTGPFVVGAGAFYTGATGTTPNSFGNFVTFTTPYNYTNGNLLVTIRHSQPQGPGGSPYWSVDAFASGYSSKIAHNDDATIATTTWSYSPVTEFTTATLTPDGFVDGDFGADPGKIIGGGTQGPNHGAGGGSGLSAVPEPGIFSLLSLGGVLFLVFRRIQGKTTLIGN